MAFKKTFIISEESVNGYGFVTRTEGIDLSVAHTNCPAFYDHRTWETPIGHWENLRKENGKLLGDVVIEGADAREKEIIRKIENGDIKGASYGADPLVWNDDPLQLMQGQTRPTLERCQIFEVSVTPLPSNQAALALKKDGQVVMLNANKTNNIVPELKLKQHPEMKAIALKLGLPETATEAEILAAIGSVQLSKQNAETLSQKVLDKAGEGLEADQKETYVILSKANPEHALKFAESCKAAQIQMAAEAVQPGQGVKLQKDVKVSDLIQTAKGKSAQGGEAKTFDWLRKNNPVELARIAKEDPDTYEQLTADYVKGVR